MIARSISRARPDWMSWPHRALSAAWVTVALRARQHHVWGDLGRLGQVFLNLLSNAVKFTPENGSIVLRTNNPRSGGPDARAPSR